PSANLDIRIVIRAGNPEHIGIAACRKGAVGRKERDHSGKRKARGDERCRRFGNAHREESVWEFILEVRGHHRAGDVPAEYHDIVVLLAQYDQSLTEPEARGFFALHLESRLRGMGWGRIFQISTVAIQRSLASHGYFFQ